MKCLHRVVAAGAVLAMGMCGIVRADSVFDQVPSDASGVFEVKDLQAVSQKVAKFAKTLGLDQFEPQFADPLAAMQENFDLKKGLNKNGDMAIAFFDLEHKKGDAGKDDVTEADAPPVVVLLPTSDYKEFLTNFSDIKDGGEGISEVTVVKNKEKLFIVKRGEYAEAAMDKALLHEPHGGLKLQGPAAKEARTRDAIIYFDMKALRPRLEKQMKEVRKTMDREFKDPEQVKNNPFAAQMTPQILKMLGVYMDAADQIINESRSAAISFNLTDTGISASAIGDFEPDSDLGRMVTQVQNTDQPLLAGLPDETYFATAGMKFTPEVSNKLFNDFLEPMLKNAIPKNNNNDKELDKAITAMKDSLSVTKSMAFGYVSTNGGANEGFLGAVGVMHGDANKILQNQKDALPAMNNGVGFGVGGKSTIEVQPGEPKNIDGVDLQTYTLKFHFDPNDPTSAQAKQMLSIMGGRNGITEGYGVVNPNTMIFVMPMKDQLVNDLVAAAKNDTDVLNQSAAIKKVSVDLPRHRAAEMYIAVDNIANTAVKALKQQGVPINFKLPPNLPPIGLTMGTVGSAARMDMVIPTQLIQSIVAAGMQAAMQNNNGQGGGI